MFFIYLIPIVCIILIIWLVSKKNKEEAEDVKREDNIKYVSFGKALFLTLTEGFLFIVCLAYFVLKGEGVLPSSFGWIAALSAMGVVILHINNKKIKIKFQKTPEGKRKLIAYKNRETVDKNS